MNMMRKYILGLVKTMDAAKELLAEPTKSVSNVPYALRYQYPVLQQGFQAYRGMFSEGIQNI